MASGRQTLHDIDNTIADARGNLEQTTELAARLSEQRAALERRRLQAIAIIASERIAALDTGEADDTRDRDIRQADRRAEELLETHAKQTADLQKRANEARAELERLEYERKEIEDDVAAAVDTFDDAAARSQQKLLQDQNYRNQLEQVEEAEAVVDRAERKQALALEDETEKGTPYREDPLFLYLWKRHYGTKDYRGGLLTKMLDDWVARLCGYRDAALNYKRLTEIPARLADHVANVEDKAATEREALAALENAALEADGAADLRTISMEAQARLEAHDKMIAEAEASHRASVDAQTEATGRNSGAYEQALEILTAALSDEDLSDLRRLAAQTRNLDDDDAVAELIRLEDEADDLEDDEDDAGELIKRYRRSLEELESVRHRFKEARYDAPSSEFPSGAGQMIGSMLGQILVGALTSGDLWDRLQRGQRTVRRRADADFGGGMWDGGFRLPTSGGRSSGRSGRSRGGSMSRPSRVPRQRSGRGGGFQTGGGF